MKKLIFAAGLLSVFIYCRGNVEVKNLTRPGGYAMGEEIELKFSVTGNNNIPDSIRVFIREKKTGFVYESFAQKTPAENINEYIYLWNGRKPDGSWPSGGMYRIYALTGGNNGSASDTVEIGLAD